MEPNPQSTPSSSPPGDVLVDYIRHNRQNAATGLLLISILFLALAIWAGVKSSGYSSDSSKSDAAKKADDKKSEFNPLNPEETQTKIGDPAQTDYTVTAIAAGVLFLIVAVAGLILMAKPPATTESADKTDIRILILALGAIVGMCLIVIGGWFFYHWSSYLSEVVNKENVEAKTYRYVFTPLLIVVAGAGLAFLAIQPARSEERHNSGVRKWVYGTNLGLSVLLLFVVLVVVNIVLAGKVPNKLDTTETGFYSLSDSTKQYLGRLDQQITAYAILPEGSGNRIIDDVRRLLRSCEDAAGGKFRLEFISPTLNPSRYRTLLGKYPILESNEGPQGGSYGVLLTTGEDEKRHTFIRVEEFEKTESMGGPGSRSSVLFVGESRLMREMQFLTESQQKAVVYFTQSSGELDIEGGAQELGPSNSAMRLKAYLERNFLEVKPLRFDAVNPKVPDDATVVIVAEPHAPLSEAMAAAIKQYMLQPHPDKKKGKLIVMSSGRFGADLKVQRTGLEGLLSEFNVRQTDQVIYGAETQDLDPLTSVVVFAPPAIRARNPVALALGEKAGFIAPIWRPITVQSAQPSGPFRAVPLLMTSPGRYTWLESEKPADVNQVMLQLRDSAEVRKAKQLSENPRPVAVVVSEGEGGRVAVIGNGLIFSDQLVRQGQGDPITFDLINATIDWLRDRPTVATGIEAKKYREWTFPIGADELRGMYLPLILVVLVVVGAGAGVWVIRRK